MMTANPAPLQNKLVLIVTGDPGLRDLLEAELHKAGYRTGTASNAKAVETFCTTAGIYLSLVDLAIPEAEITIQMLRAAGAGPTLVLAGSDEDEKRSRAFDLGASDYVTKPLLEPTRLFARMNIAIALHEKPASNDATFTLGGLSVDIWRRRVTLHGRDIRLTPVEFGLLALLVRKAGQVVTQREILKEVWNSKPEKHGHYLRIYMQRLRQKLGDNPFAPQYLFTEPRIGYRLGA